MQPLKIISLAFLQLRVCTCSFAAIAPTLKPAHSLDSFGYANYRLPENLRTRPEITQPNDTTHPKSAASILPTAPSSTISINLPSDPFYQSFITVRVKFYDYGGQLSVDPRYTCISQAQSESLVHTMVEAEILMGTNVRTYGGTQATLEIRPGKDMTWRMFSSALVVLWSFYEKYESVSLTFDVTDLEIGYMGSGFIRAS